MRQLTSKEAKQRMLIVLDEMDRYCKEHNLTYMLSYGTLLGAIRHEGFIPWDDDLDVMMPWNDYVKFCKEYESEDFYVTDVNKDKDYQLPYSRLIDKRTVQIVHGRKDFGINIDVYPLYHFPKDYFTKDYPWMIRTAERKDFISRLIRGFDRIKMSFMAKPLIALRRVYVKQIRNKIYALAESHEYVMNKVVPYHEIRPIDESDIKDVTEAKFEGKFYPIPKGWDNILTEFYGNYMELPPEDQRQPYHGASMYYSID